MSTLLSVIIVISAIIVTASVIMQEGKERGDATFVPPEPIWGPNKGIGREFMLKRVTIVATAVFMISTLGLLMVSK